MNAVVTYIFGKGQEILRDPLVTDPGVQYICVTDQKELTSNTWTVIYDNIPQAKCIRDKMPMVKYNPFKYTNADRIIIMDGALQITHSLNNMFAKLNETPLLIKKHPERNDLLSELNTWITKRGLPSQVIDAFTAMSLIDKIPLTNNFLVESCIIGFHNTSQIRKLCASVLAVMSFLSNGHTLCMTNQCPLTYLVEKLQIPYTWINQSDVANRYYHNSWRIINR